MNAAVDVTNIRIETERLILRSWRETDLEDFYEYAKADGVGQMAGWSPHKSIEESRQVLRLFMEEKKTFALELKENGKVIGSLGLETQERELEVPAGTKGREIGYAISRDYWGRGLTPEAVKAVIRYCFRELDFDWLTCGHFLWNTQSRRVVEKCGFQYVKDAVHHTRFGTEEPMKLYILHNGHKLYQKMNAPMDVTDIRIETPRLILRALEEGDLQALHEISSDPEIAKYDGWKVSGSLEETRKRMLQAIEEKEDLAVVLKETGRMIGTFGIQPRNWLDYPIDRELKGREFGFDLNQAYWGRGLMPEAVSAVADYCFRSLSYGFITCGHFLGNERSARLIEKCGFSFLFEAEHTMPTGSRPMIRTYIRYNPYKEKNYV